MTIVFWDESYFLCSHKTETWAWIHSCQAANNIRLKQ